MGAEPVIARGKVYLSTPKGILYKTEQDGTLTEYWRLPSQCSWMSPTSQQDGETLVFSTFAENTPEQPIYAQLDPKSMETSFFTSSKEDIFYAALSDGRYCALLFDKDPLLRVWDPEENSAFSFPLPQELTQLVTNTSFYGENNGLVPLACTNPAAGSLFAFTLSDHEGNPARICLCDCTQFGRVGFPTTATLADIHKFITDAPPEASVRDALSAAGVECIVAQRASNE